MREAQYWESLRDGSIRCNLCPHRCIIPPDQSGLCRARSHHEGRLLAESFGMYTSLQADPIEKKPLYHFLPGQTILSIGNNGCNLRCSFCQNWQISQQTAPTLRLDPEDLVARVAREGGIGVAFTYAEPMIWFEYVLDAARRLRAAGLRTVLVTNGTIQPEPLGELVEWVDAMNVDLKSIRSEFYSQQCRGFLHTVQETLRIVAPRCHLEVTNLLIPNLNDDPQEIRELAEFVASIDPDIPLHLSRYFPRYRLGHAPTDPEILWRAREIASQSLRWVYLGNVSDPRGSESRCPHCSRLLVSRAGYRTRLRIDEPRCPDCGEALPFVLA